MAFKVKMRDGSEHVINSDKHKTNGSGTYFMNNDGVEVAAFRDGLIDYVIPHIPGEGETE